MLYIVSAICFIAYFRDAWRKTKTIYPFTQALKIAIPTLFNYTKLCPPVFISAWSLRYSETQLNNCSNNGKTDMSNMAALFLSWHKHFNRNWRCWFSLMYQCNDACKPDGRPCISVLISNPQSKLLSDVYILSTETSEPLIDMFPFYRS